MDPVRQAIVKKFDSSDRVSFLATLFRLARADEVSAAERDRLQPVADWLDATTEECLQAMRMADDITMGIRDIVGKMTAASKSLLLFRECCAVAWADGRKSEQEQEFLDLLVSILGLSDDSRIALDTPLACSPEGERRFLQLLGGTISTQTESEIPLVPGDVQSLATRYCKRQRYSQVTSAEPLDPNLDSPLKARGGN